MYCKYCGSHIADDSKFCSECGTKVNDFYSRSDFCQQDSNIDNRTRSKVFAFVGFGLGITAFVISFMFIAGYCAFLFAIPGIIFSVQGKKSVKASYAKKGLVFSILGLILGFVISTIILLLMIIFY